MKRATIYQRKESFFVHSNSKTTAGVWVLGAPFVKLDVGAENVQVGEAVLAALRESRQGVAHPTNWKAVSAPLLAQAGVKSWRVFAKGTRCVEIEADGGAISFVPTLNLGADGFEGDVNQTRVVSTATAEVLGATARELLILHRSDPS